MDEPNVSPLHRTTTQPQHHNDTKAPFVASFGGFVLFVREHPYIEQGKILPSPTKIILPAKERMIKQHKHTNAQNTQESQRLVGLQ